LYSIAQSNPSFEIWLYYHFYEKKPNADEVAQYNTSRDEKGNLTLYSTEVYQLADKIVALSHKDLNTLKRMM